MVSQGEEAWEGYKNYRDGTRFLVVEIPPDASDKDAENLMELVTEAAYNYVPMSRNWDPFIYGWTFPSDQAIERPKR